MNPLSVRDIASIGFPMGMTDGRLLMLKMYLDDTGTHGGSPVVGVGGLIGTEAQWTDFDTRWKALLAEPVPGAPPIRMWHSWHCRFGEGEFSAYGEADRDFATQRFRTALTESGVISAANMIDNQAWDELVVAKFGQSMATAEATALFRLIDRVMPWATHQSEGPDVTIYYDLGRKRKEIEQLAGLLTDGATRYPYVTSFTFMAVARATPLQGADMIATESFWHAKDFLKYGEDAPVRPHFKDYLGSGLID